MSELNGQNGQNDVNGTTSPAKEGFFKRVGKGIRKGYDRFRYSKAGRIIVPTVKALTVVGAVYESYQLGKKSVKPTTVYIQPVNEAEETPKEEAPAEETEKAE